MNDQAAERIHLIAERKLLCVEVAKCVPQTLKTSRRSNGGDSMDSDAPVSQELVLPEAGHQSEREAVRASVFRRVLGWLIDYVIVMIPAIVLVGFALAGMLHGLPGYIGSVAAEFGWSQLIRLITHHGTGAGALGAAASKEWVTFALPLIGALLLVPLVQFLYQATLLAWRGRTIGKMLADTRVGTAGQEAARVRVRAALSRALSTTVLETGIVCVALVVVTVGQIFIGGIIWAVAVLAFWVNVFAALGSRRRTIVDRLAGTVVVRRALYAKVTERTVDLALRTSDAAIAASRKTSQTAVTAGRKAADATVVVGQLTRETTGALVRSTPVQQVLNSRASQQAQALGAVGADRAWQLGEQAAGRARKFGGRAQQMWKERQAKRSQQEETPALTEKPEYPTPE